MAAASFPLPLRNALAELAIAALDDAAARAALAWLAAPDGEPDAAAGDRLRAVHLLDPGAATLLDVHHPWQDAIQSHAQRAGRAAARWHAETRPANEDRVDGAVVRAAALWSEALLFEVHEVLETEWKQQRGPVRQALQGVIQVAVAFHHLRHGNVRGARTLLHEGRGRLAGVPADTLPALDATALLADTAPWDDALAAGTEPPAAPIPLLRVR